MPSEAAAVGRVGRAFAWAGGTVFAGSLLYFLYSYLFRFYAAPRPRSALLPVTFDVALFSIFALHHSMFARGPVKAWLTRFVPAPLERSVYVWIASLLFIGVCAAWQLVPGDVYTLAGPWRAAAYLVQLAAIVMTGRASAALDVLDLAGIRNVGRARPQSGPTTLRTSGLFGFVRHPLYFAWTLFVFATPDMTGTRLVFAVVSCAYVVVAIPWEERALVATFGTAYHAYRTRVRWRMIPFVF
jgi:protein-S-isoprenylcysteine O-methyltransferase Ste14